MTIDITTYQVSEKLQESEVVLSVQGVSKKFCRNFKRSLFYGVQDITAELVGIRGKNEKLRAKEFWALKDVSFELRRGEAVGLLGKNGSGKSTLLRIVAGLIKPDTGSVEVKGRVAPLIALGAGFNPILTGRENIYANMSILGLSKKEIDERFDEVVEFAEIGDAIDAPVQNYSSGMAARLGFASAIYTEPDILLIDEVLAVGDAKFQDKCTRQLQKVRDKGTSFVLVSHNSMSIRAICESSIYLSKGNIVKAGSTFSVLSKYEEDLFVTSNEVSAGKVILPPKTEAESLGLDISYICFRDQQKNLINHPEVGNFFSICIGCKIRQKDSEVTWDVYIRDLSRGGEHILMLSSNDSEQTMVLEPGNMEVQIQLPYCGLRKGLYEMSIYIQRKPDYRLDSFRSFVFEVKDYRGAIYDMNHNLFYQPRLWNFCEGDLSLSK